MLVCAFLCASCTRDRGCSAHPAFPAPSVWERGANVRSKPRANRAARRRSYVGNGNASTAHTLSSPAHARVMTACVRCLRCHFQHSFAFSRHGLPEVLTERSPLSPKQREQGMPGARCTRGLVCKMHKEKRTRAYRFSGGSPAFPAQWLYGLCRDLPGDEFVLSPSLPA